MIQEILLTGSFSALSAIIGYLVAKKVIGANFDLLKEQAKAKARAIEQEAQLILQKANVRSTEIELEAKKVYEEASSKAKSELDEREALLSKKEKEFEGFKQSELEVLDIERKALKDSQQRVERNHTQLEALKQKYTQQLDESIEFLSGKLHLNEAQAKEKLNESLMQKYRLDYAKELRVLDEQNKSELKRKAIYILAQATSRYAGEFASERLINMVDLNDDELKGRIIGKEGRNIKTLEMLLGVDIIIDETPNVIIVSSFNLYRRAIATRTLQLLVEDGRIQPARIEEIFEKVTQEFEDSLMCEGEGVLLEMGLLSMHPELTRLLGKLKYRASYGQNALAHTKEVAYLAGIMASELGADVKLARRAGLLHDIGKALTHEQEGSHVDIGVELCKRYGEDEVVINAIYAHHGYEEIHSIECACVCAADALSAARPGARREVLENFTKRVNEIEEIALQKEGVKQAYAISAGREVRVFVDAMRISDDESVLIAKEIAHDIESRVQFPGVVKVNVIREKRTEAFAK